MGNEFVEYDFRMISINPAHPPRALSHPMWFPPFRRRPSLSHFFLQNFSGLDDQTKHSPRLGGDTRLTCAGRGVCEFLQAARFRTEARKSWRSPENFGRHTGLCKEHGRSLLRWSGTRSINFLSLTQTTTNPWNSETQTTFLCFDCLSLVLLR